MKSFRRWWIKGKIVSDNKNTEIDEAVISLASDLVKSTDGLNRLKYHLDNRGIGIPEILRSAEITDEEKVVLLMFLEDHS